MKKNLVIDRTEIDKVLEHYSLTKKTLEKPISKIFQILEAIDNFQDSLSSVMLELQEEGATEEELTNLQRVAMRACNRSIDHYRDLIP